jgi:hypothetical protein
MERMRAMKVGCMSGSEMHLAMDAVLPGAFRYRSCTLHTN